MRQMTGESLVHGCLLGFLEQLLESIHGGELRLGFVNIGAVGFVGDLHGLHVRRNRLDFGGEAADPCINRYLCHNGSILSNV